jgi:universal stress protein E
MNSYTTLSTEPPQLVQQVADAVEAEHRAALDALLAQVPLGRYELQFVRGNVRELLPAHAEEIGAGFVVLGAVARGAIARFFLGSTAEQVLDRIPCDLVVIKPPGFSETPDRARLDPARPRIRPHADPRS